jgi:hypothetical protein
MKNIPKLFTYFSVSVQIGCLLNQLKIKGNFSYGATEYLTVQASQGLG